MSSLGDSEYIPTDDEYWEGEYNMPHAQSPSHDVDVVPERQQEQEEQEISTGVETLESKKKRPGGIQRKIMHLNEQLQELRRDAQEQKMLFQKSFFKIMICGMLTIFTVCGLMGMVCLKALASDKVYITQTVGKDFDATIAAMKKQMEVLQDTLVTTEARLVKLEAFAGLQQNYYLPAPLPSQAVPQLVSDHMISSILPVALLSLALAAVLPLWNTRKQWCLDQKLIRDEESTKNQMQKLINTLNQKADRDEVPTNAQIQALVHTVNNKANQDEVPTNRQIEELINTVNNKANQDEVPTNNQMQALINTVNHDLIKRIIRGIDVKMLPREVISTIIQMFKLNKATSEFGATCAQDILKEGYGLLSGGPHDFDGLKGHASAWSTHHVVVMWSNPVDVAHVAFRLWDRDNRTYAYEFEFKDIKDQWHPIGYEAGGGLQGKSWQRFNVPGHGGQLVKALRWKGKNNKNAIFHLVELEVI